jgi:hypothetical protein
MKNPTMLYKSPGPHEIHGGHFDYTIIDGDEVEQAIADGWSLTTTEAKTVHESALNSASKPMEIAAANAAPTRQELEAKATELGLAFNGRNSDKTLGEMIAAALTAA